MHDGSNSGVFACLKFVRLWFWIVPMFLEIGHLFLYLMLFVFQNQHLLLRARRFLCVISGFRLVVSGLELIAGVDHR